jgi:hypothetical protein
MIGRGCGHCWLPAVNMANMLGFVHDIIEISLKFARSRAKCGKKNCGEQKWKELHSGRGQCMYGAGGRLLFLNQSEHRRLLMMLSASPTNKETRSTSTTCGTASASSHPSASPWILAGASCAPPCPTHLPSPLWPPCQYRPHCRLPLRRSHPHSLSCTSCGTLKRHNAVAYGPLADHFTRPRGPRASSFLKSTPSLSPSFSSIYLNLQHNPIRKNSR